MSPPIMLKCQFPGCPDQAVAGDGDAWYCGVHFNNVQRLKCLERGCKHRIPDQEEA